MPELVRSGDLQPEERGLAIRSSAEDTTILPEVVLRAGPRLHREVKQRLHNKPLSFRNTNRLYVYYLILPNQKDNIFTRQQQLQSPQPRDMYSRTFLTDVKRCHLRTCRTHVLTYRTYVRMEEVTTAPTIRAHVVTVVTVDRHFVTSIYIYL